MDYQWDPNKATSNLDKHGIDLPMLWAYLRTNGHSLSKKNTLKMSSAL